MFTKISFRNVVFIVLCVIFTLYAIDAITINPKLIPLLLIVSIYLLTCKNWNIFSKENREEFNEDEKGTLVIPGNLKVTGKLIVDENARFAKQIDTNSLYVTNSINSGSLNVRGDTTIDKSLKTKDLKVTSIYSNTTHHPDVNIQNKVNMNKDVTIDGNITIKKAGGTLTTPNIACSDTIKTKNITADWSTGAGDARFCKLSVDQLYGFAWEGTKTNTILMSHNLVFSTPDQNTPLMKFTTAHDGRGDDKKQGLVIIDDAELRIHNRGGGHATHFNHKTNPNSDAGYYGNWLRMGLRYLHVHDGINAGSVNVRGNLDVHGIGSFKSQVKNVWSHINWSDGQAYFRGNIKLDGAGETGSMALIGNMRIKNNRIGVSGGSDLVFSSGGDKWIRVFGYDTNNYTSNFGIAANKFWSNGIIHFNKLNHHSGDGSIHRDDNAEFTIETDNMVKFILGGQTIYLKYDGTNQYHFWRPHKVTRL